MDTCHETDNKSKDDGQQHSNCSKPQEGQFVQKEDTLSETSKFRFNWHACKSLPGQLVRCKISGQNVGFFRNSYQNIIAKIRVHVIFTQYLVKESLT